MYVFTYHNMTTTALHRVTLLHAEQSKTKIVISSGQYNQPVNLSENVRP